MDYKYHFKVILVGNAGVGKTAMVRRFTKGFFPFKEAPTIGVDMSVKTVEVDGEKVKVKVTYFSAINSEDYNIFVLFN